MNKDFDNLDLSNVKDIETKYGPGRTGKLPDGSSVSTRLGSESNKEATLEVSRPDKFKLKIRYLGGK